MKVQVRKGVFESNSSSTHAIAISTENDVKLRFPEEVVFKYGEFGWEERTISSVQEKASYLYTALYYVFQNSPEKWKHYIQFIFETLRENEVECKFEGCIDQSVSVYDSYYSQDNKKEIRFYSSITGYVDHGDEAINFVEAVCTDKGLLLSYLFSKHSFIRTGNDNDDSDISIDSDYTYEVFYKGN